MTTELNNPRIPWKRDPDCSCSHELRGEGTGNGGGDYRLVRTINDACLRLGVAVTRLDAAIEAAVRLIRTTPGAGAINEATLRRVLAAVYPILLGIEPPVTPTPPPDAPGAAGAAAPK
jgi:hypothetical protein